MLTESWSSERSKNQKDRTFVILTHGNQLKLKIHIMVLCPRVYIPGCHSLERGSFINYTGQIRLRLEGSFVCSSRMDVSSGGGREWAGTVCIHKRTEETVVSNQQNGNQKHWLAQLVNRIIVSLKGEEISKGMNINVNKEMDRQ